MMDALKKAGTTDFIINKRGTYAVDTSKFSCDYYDYKKGVVSAINGYRNEYMINYRWAGYRTAELSF